MRNRTFGDVHSIGILGRSDTSSFFVGQTERGKEVWLPRSMMLNHLLVSGRTGAGKTEFLLNILHNTIAQGGGGVFVDGKGSVGGFARVLDIAELYNRTDDVYVINFTNRQSGATFHSHSINPLQYLSAEAASSLFISMMHQTGGDGDMWKGRAMAMLWAVLRPLVWLRDNQGLHLDINVLRDHLNLKRIIDLSGSAHASKIPEAMQRSTLSYLASLPGFKLDKGYNQSQTTLDQHGYLEMQWTRLLGMMADVYGDIFCSPHSDIDIRDIVDNRRILVVLLPALEKANDEIANLGKFILATIKTIAASRLSSNVEQTWGDVFDHQPIRNETPFTCIFDEISYYMVDGMDILASQSRSLGINLVFATQEIGMMLRANYVIASNLLANCSTKILFETNQARSEEALAFLDIFNHYVPEFELLPFLKNLFRWRAQPRSTIQDILRNLPVGTFYLTHKDVALPVQGASPLPRRGHARPRQLIDHRSLAKDMWASTQTKETKVSEYESELTEIPDHFSHLLSVDASMSGALPGGHAFISACLKTLAEFDYRGTAKNKAPVERVMIGD